MINQYLIHLSTFKSSIMYDKTRKIIQFFIDCFSVNKFYAIEVRYLLDGESSGPKYTVLRPLFFSKVDAENKSKELIDDFVKRYHQNYEDGKIFFDIEKVLEYRILDFNIHDSYF